MATGVKTAFSKAYLTQPEEHTAEIYLRTFEEKGWPAPDFWMAAPTGNVGLCPVYTYPFADRGVIFILDFEEGYYTPRDRCHHDDILACFPHLADSPTAVSGWSMGSIVNIYNQADHPRVEELEALVQGLFPNSKQINMNREYFGNAKLGSILSPVRDELDPAIWDGDRLRPEVKDFCVGVVEDYLSTFIPTDEIGNYLKRLILIGSITGYQYDPDADLDVNILVDLEKLASERGLEKELLIYEMRGEVGRINGELYPGTEHPVNIFLATTDDMPPADGIYDFFTDNWLKKPGHPGDIDPYANLRESIDRAEEVAGKVDAKWGAAVRTYAEIERYPQSGLQIQRQFLRYMKSMKRILKNVVDERREIMDMARDQGLDPPQTSTPNVVYKYLEYNGLLDKLHEVSTWLNDYEESGHMAEFPSKGPRSLTEPSESNSGTTGTPMQLAARRRHSRRSEEEIYPLADNMVDGLLVREEIPNTESIESSLVDYEVLPGVRVVPLSEFSYGQYYSVSDNDRVRELASAIQESGEINPLIVVVDGHPDGPYILEGGHRSEALNLLGKEFMPALVVLENGE